MGRKPARWAGKTRLKQSVRRVGGGSGGLNSDSLAEDVQGLEGCSMVAGLKVYCGWTTFMAMSTSRAMGGKSTGFVAYEGRLNV